MRENYSTPCRIRAGRRTQGGRNYSGTCRNREDVPAGITAQDVKIGQESGQAVRRASGNYSGGRRNGRRAGGEAGQGSRRRRAGIGAGRRAGGSRDAGRAKTPRNGRRRTQAKKKPPTQGRTPKKPHFEAQEGTRSGTQDAGREDAGKRGACASLFRKKSKRNAPKSLA